MGGIYGELMHSGQTRATPATSVAEFSASETLQAPSPERSRRSGLRRAIAKPPSASNHHIAADDDVDETDDEPAPSTESDAYLEDENEEVDGDGQADESAGDELTEDDEDLVRPRRRLIVTLKCRKLLSAASQAPPPVLDAIPKAIPT